MQKIILGETSTRRGIRNLTGQNFGRLKVTKYSGKEGRRHFWECQCDCGEIREVRSDHLLSGHTTSCGCFHREQTRTHGMSLTRPYRIWSGMWQRCSNPREMHYNDYGGRGISVCKRWESFEAFWQDMQPNYDPRLTLHRCDNNGNYTKRNCVWATPKVQARCTRGNRLVALPSGEKVPVVVAAEITGLTANTIHSRIHFGWPAEDLLKPARIYRKAA